MKGMLELEYLGHSAFALRDGEAEVLIDPYLSENPKAPPSAKDVRPSLILVSHAHGDHVGDTVELAHRFECPVLSTFEVGNVLAEMGAKVISGHIGGEFEFPFCRVKMFPAVHSSSFDDVHAVGAPCSFLVTMGGHSVFHAGDTALFGDLALIAEEAEIEAALLPVGGVYTMGIRDAVRAARLLRAGKMVPMHYNTWEPIAVDEGEMMEAVREQPFELVVLRPGERTVL